MAGLPGTGKSTLAGELAKRTRGTVLSKDMIRHAIFTATDIEYSARQDDFCLQVLLEAAGFLFERDPDRRVFVDGRTFSRRYQIENVLSAATAMHQPLRILECICSEKTAQRRLAADAAAGTQPAGNRGYQLYLEIKARFESILQVKVAIDTDQPLETWVQLGLDALE